MTSGITFLLKIDVKLIMFAIESQKFT